MKIIKTAGRILKYLFTALLGVLLAANIVNIVQMTVLKQEMPTLFGYGRAVVVTGSMEPAVKPGDMVVFHKQDSYQTGDIVMYKANSYITHRIISETQNGYVTQGDANNAPDGEIQKSQVVGRVVLIIPKAGYVIDFFKTPFGILLLVAALFLMIEIPAFIDKIKDRGRTS